MFVSKYYVLVFVSRIEMWTNMNTKLRSRKGSTSIHAWWFRLRNNVVVGSHGFFHIFQVMVIDIPSVTYPDSFGSGPFWSDQDPYRMERRENFKSLGNLSNVFKR
jgi:hypothetical protein